MNSRHNGAPRLLVLTPDFPPKAGGVQSLIHELTRSLTAFDIEVVTLAGFGAPHFDGESALTIRRTGKHLRQKRAKMMELNAAAVRRALWFRPHLTLSAHVIVSPAAYAIRRLLGARTVQYFYGGEIAGKPRLSRFAAARADLVLAISAHTASLLHDAGANPRRLEVIPPGVHLPTSCATVRSGRPTVLTIAQLKHEYKGHDVTIRALPAIRERVPDVEWVVVGEGRLRASLEQSAAEQGVAGLTRFLGKVSDQERDAWLRRAHVFVMPSRLPGEGFGIVFLEASAHGTPVVAGDAAGAREAVVNGVTGLLVDPTEPVPVADAVASLLENPTLAERLGGDGAKRAQTFAWPLIAARVERELLELLP